MSLASEKYISLTTYKRDSTSNACPVWVVDAGDGTLAFTTFSSSLKVLRLNRNRHVLVQPCDARGNVRAGTAPVAGTAEVHQGAEFERVRQLVKSKYGIQFTMINLVGRVRKLVGKDSGTDTAVVITLTDSDDGSDDDS
jgi:PPOX class probable F420-dependent enzyme